MEEKTCAGECNRTLELRYFSFRSDTNKYRPKCRRCSKGYKSSLLDRQDTIQGLLSKGDKKCGKCNEIKPLDSFNKDKYTVTGRTSLCKTCTAIRTKKTRKSRQLQIKAKRYNITLSEVSELAKIKSCQICGNDFSKHREAHIDHCHTTGKVRGVLCRTCNLGIGHLKDDVVILKKAIKYLSKQ